MGLAHSPPARSCHPITLKTHSREPVPFVIAGKGIEPDGVEGFDEQWAKKGGYGRVDATSLIGILAG